MFLGEVEELLRSTDHNGFPVVVSMESQYLVGFVLRRDLTLAVNNAKSRIEGITQDTLVLFSNQVFNIKFFLVWYLSKQINGENFAVVDACWIRQKPTRTIFKVLENRRFGTNHNNRQNSNGNCYQHV